jgi:hypothetical protein
VAQLQYVSNLLIPRISYETGQFRYYHPITGDDVTSTIDAWTNDWTEQENGLTAIRLRTQYSVQKQYLRDLDGAQETLAAWLESVAQLEEETEQKTSGITFLEGSIL